MIYHTDFDKFFHNDQVINGVEVRGGMKDVLIEEAEKISNLFRIYSRQDPQFDVPTVVFEFDSDDSKFYWQFVMREFAENDTCFLNAMYYNPYSKIRCN